jgi:hypothetical protein
MYAGLLVLGLGTAWELLGGKPVVEVDGPQPIARPVSADPLRTDDPKACLALSGGGVRSAAFGVGVLSGLHEIGALSEIEVISAVSGGTYALSWFLLQPYYELRPDSDENGGRHRPSAGVADEVAIVLDRMFDPGGEYQAALERRANMAPLVETGLNAMLSATLSQVLRAFSAATGDLPGANLHGARLVYRNRIQHVFQARPSEDNVRPEAMQTSSFWFVDPVSFPDLLAFLEDAELPFAVFNATLRVDESHRELLWSTVFEITPRGMGADSYDYADWTETRLLSDAFSAVASPNLAPAISGAALSASQQTGSDWLRRVVNHLNLDLGYYVPGFARDDASTIYLSDGGHSENLGVYSLLRRRCRSIIVADAEDERCGRESDRGPGDCVDTSGAQVRYQFDSLKQLVERLATEPTPLELSVDLSDFDPRAPLIQGRAIYGEPSPSERDNVLYFKLAMDRDRIDDYPSAAERLKRYARAAETFPHDPTSNQRFNGDQFAAYRDLGYWMVLENRDRVERLLAGSDIEGSALESADGSP